METIGVQIEKINESQHFIYFFGASQPISRALQLFKFCAQ